MKTLVFLLCLGLFQAAYADALEDARAVLEKGDYKTAIELFKPIAEQGNPEAQHNVGFMYDQGLGVQRDYQKAIEWYRKAADQGYADSQYNLGGMYLNGLGVSQDYKKAVKWFRKVAEQGYSYAQNNLGVMYANGFGVAKNFIQAYAWFATAAAQGDAGGVENRDMLAKKMTSAEIADAQGLAREYADRYNKEQ